MRIRDAEGTSLDHVYVELTEFEAKNLIVALIDLLTADDQGWHARVDNHTHTVEVVVARETERGSESSARTA
jgi:hypothetical protein